VGQDRRTPGRPDADDERAALERRLTALEVENAQLRQELGSFTSDLEASRRRPTYLDLGATIARFQELLGRAGGIIADVAADGTFEGASESLRDVLGYETAELQGRSIAELIHPDDRRVAARMFRGLGGAGPAQQAFRVRHRDGRWRWLEIDVVSREGLDGAVHPLAYARDVTEMHEALEALRQSEDRYRALAENAVDLIVEIDLDGTLHYVSPNCKEILGVPAERLMGRSLAELRDEIGGPDSDSHALLAGFQERLRRNRDVASEIFRVRDAAGRERWFESRMRVYRHSSGHDHAVVIARDVSERLAAESELARLEQRYRLLGESSLDVITESDPDGKLVFVSGTCKEVFGYEPEELLGSLGRGLIVDAERDRVVAHFTEAFEAGERTIDSQHRCRRKDGEEIWCDSRSVLYYRHDGSGPFTVCSLRDVTSAVRLQQEQRALEERVQRAARLEGLGVMAGGIAHDFNNLLTPILGQTSLALMDLPADHPVRERLERVRTGARRAAELTEQMLAYAGARPLLFDAVDVSAVVREMARLLESAVSGRAVVRFELAEGLPRVEADDAQLGQVVMNLITNAVEAVGEGRGEIALRTYALPGKAVSLRELVVGEVDRAETYVCCEVEDSGVGMDSEVRSRIFDPFFTSKFMGRGLGLAAVVGIIQSHSGAIEMRSAPGEGTRFRVLLPTAAEQGAPGAIAGPSPAQGVVLLADDDEGVRELVRDALERAGLEVLAAGDGREAIQLFRERADEVRAVLLDRTMPVVSGELAYEEIRRLRPDVPVVLVSGYSEQAAVAAFGERGLSGFLKKPFSPEELIELVTGLVAGGRGGPAA